MAAPAAGPASVRFRLLAIALLPTLVILPLLLGVTMSRWNAKFDSLLISKVNGDLTIAHQYFNRILENTGEHIRALGNSAKFRDTLETPKGGRSQPSWRTTGAGSGSISSCWSMRRGTVLSVAPSGAQPHRHHAPGRRRRACRHVVDRDRHLFDGDELSAISPELADRRARSDPDPQRRADRRDRETRGMVVHSATPVNLAGRPGALVGGILLNRNLDFIDTINDLVYREASLPEGSQGTATLFLDDVRVCTNVRLFEAGAPRHPRLGDRALDGAGRGQIWLDRAFVVNDWYISAYEPIVDSGGQRVGMLYVGFLETPFNAPSRPRSSLLGTFLLAAWRACRSSCAGRAASSGRSTDDETIAQVEAGDLSARSHIRTADEIARVARHLDDLLDRIQERDRQLRDWNEELNDRVDERTHELREANRQLEATTEAADHVGKACGDRRDHRGHRARDQQSHRGHPGQSGVLRAILGETAKCRRPNSA